MFYFMSVQDVARSLFVLLSPCCSLLRPETVVNRNLQCMVIVVSGCYGISEVFSLVLVSGPPNFESTTAGVPC
jgi:hypothetical protein